MCHFFFKYCVIFISLIIFANNSAFSSYEFLSLSDLIVDHIGHLPSSELEKIVTIPGGTEQVDSQKAAFILSQYKPCFHHHSPGGSTANTLRGLAQLGHQCAIMGKLGNDEWGSFYQSEMQKSGVDVYLSISSSPTAQCICISDSSGQRNMLTNIAASAEIHPRDLQQEPFQHLSILCCEAYSIYKKETFLTALNIAQQQGSIIAIDLGSYNLVKEFQSDFNFLLENYFDIVFADVHEAFALTGIKDSCSAALAIAAKCQIAIVHDGANGGFVVQGSNIIKYDAFIVENVIDTTGAGDLFACGFLHGYINNEPLHICALQGAALGAAVVQVEGALLPKETMLSLVNYFDGQLPHFHFTTLSSAKHQ
ncbi:MAG: adenosine kinase [Chlamydiales bacterium]|nr:adenosine kinase [Chlamydiales bacterium]